MVETIDHINTVNIVLDAYDKERGDSNDPVEPDLICKHTLYALAWDIIRLPSRDDCALGDVPARCRERTRIKRQCRAYAKARGYDLSLHASSGENEVWSLFKDGWDLPWRGTLRGLCLKIVEWDTWPEGKPEDTP